MLRQRGLSQYEIAETLSVSNTFVKKIIRLYDITGTVSDLPRRKSQKRKISGKAAKNLSSEIKAFFESEQFVVDMIFFVSRRNSFHSSCN